MSILKGYSSIELYLDNDFNGRSVTKRLMKHRDAKDMSFVYKGHKDMNQWLMENAKKGLGQEARDVSLLPQKQTRFTPGGRKEKNKSKVFQIKTSVRPISILLYAYLPEHYKIETGSVRR
jgi:hypothetical protein